MVSSWLNMSPRQATVVSFMKVFVSRSGVKLDYLYRQSEGGARIGLATPGVCGMQLGQVCK